MLKSSFGQESPPDSTRQTRAAHFIDGRASRRAEPLPISDSLHQKTRLPGSTKLREFLIVTRGRHDNLWTPRSGYCIRAPYFLASFSETASIRKISPTLEIHAYCLIPARSGYDISPASVRSTGFMPAISVCSSYRTWTLVSRSSFCCVICFNFPHRAIPTYSPC